MPADSLDGRQATSSGPGVRGCRFRVLRWEPCPGGKVGPSDSDDDIPQVVEVRVQYCSCWRANFGRWTITICDREAHAHGLHTRTAHRQMSEAGSQCAGVRAGLDAHAPAEPMRRRFAGRAW